LQGMIKQGIEHPGFSFIEAVVPCPTEYGKRNVAGGVLAMLDDEKARAVDVDAARALTNGELEGKIVTGVLHRDTTRPEYQQTYAGIIERAQTEAEAAALAEPQDEQGEELQA